MGFLSSPLAERQQAALQQNFQIGLQMANEDVARKFAAAQSVRNFQMQQAVQAQQIKEQRAYEGEIRKQALEYNIAKTQDQDKKEFTNRQVAIGEKALYGGYHTYMQSLAPVLRDTGGIWDEATVKTASENAKKAFGIYNSGILGLMNVKPGDSPNITPALGGFDTLPTVDFKYSPAYLDKLQKEGQYKEALTNKALGFTTQTKTPKWQTEVQKAIAGYSMSEDQLAEAERTVDPAMLAAGQKVGTDPLSGYRVARNNHAIKLAEAAYGAHTALLAEDSDQGDIYRALLSKKLKPFDPAHIAEVGGALYNFYTSPNITPEQQAAIERITPTFTGRSLDAFKPARPTTTFNGPSIFLPNQGAGYPPAATPQAFGMTPPPAQEEETTDEDSAETGEESQ